MRRQKAVALDDQEPWGHLVLRARACASAASRIRPSPICRNPGLEPELRARPCRARLRVGVRRRARARAEVAGASAHRLSPRDPFLATYAPVVRYMALFALGRYEEAVAVCRATAALHPHHVGAWRLMTVSLGLLGRIDEAREALAHALRCSLISPAPTSPTIRYSPTRRTARAFSRACATRDCRTSNGERRHLTGPDRRAAQQPSSALRLLQKSGQVTARPPELMHRFMHASKKFGTHWALFFLPGLLWADASATAKAVTTSTAKTTLAKRSMCKSPLIDELA